MNKVGSVVWFKGDEVTITTEPYVKFGGMFQDAVTAGGKTVAVATPAQKEKNSEANRKAWADQQADFKKLSQ